MHRILRHNTALLSAIASKSGLFFLRPVTLPCITVVAGLYKPASLGLEHGLILNSLAGAAPIAKTQLHGKRQKRTVSVTAKLSGNRIWAGIDKLIQELMPKIGDLKTIKFKKPAKQNYSLRIRQKFSPLADFEDLVSSRMYDSHKGVFLPFTAHFSIKGAGTHLIAEQYLRSLRVPFNFYKTRPAPAFDDAATFDQGF